MRLILLLLVLAAIGLGARQMLHSSVPAAASQPDRPAAPANAESLRRFGQDVQQLTTDAAADRARRAEEATR